MPAVIDGNYGGVLFSVHSSSYYNSCSAALLNLDLSSLVLILSFVSLSPLIAHDSFMF